MPRKNGAAPQCDLPAHPTAAARLLPHLTNESDGDSYIRGISLVSSANTYSMSDSRKIMPA